MILKLNLCKSRSLMNLEIKYFLKQNEKILTPKVFYFADSLGNMNSQNVKFICKVIKNNWSGDFGIHAHNNCGLALSNTITAIENGANWVDSTILGMEGGRYTETEFCFYFK